jgi:hypothetical protein
MRGLKQAETFRTVALVANAIMLSGCMANNGLIAPQAKQAFPLLTSEGYKWYPTVNDANGAENEVTGINDSDDVVGNYTSNANLTSSGGDCSRGQTTGEHGGACSDCPLPHGTETVGGINWSSFTAQLQSKGYGNFAEIDYPDAAWQYLYGISDRASSSGPTVEVGCLVYFGGSSGDTDGSWGVVDNGGLWSVLSKHTGSNKCHYESHTGRDAIGELLGIDSTSKVAVGYNNKFSSATAGADCLLEPWQDQPGDNTSPIVLYGSSVPNWTNIEATGISNQSKSLATVVGTATTREITSGVYRQVGWALTGTKTVPTPLTYPGSKSTAVTGVAWVNSKAAIVGWFIDSSNKTHGFVYNGPSTKQWAQIDEPNSSGFTIVSGINSLGDICGWYPNSSGFYSGFVGKWQSANHQKRHRTSARAL